jgi:3,4-dihydroxy 2-butanone 4-phosphate synthase / GTP cyclohydrolase II
MNHKQETKMPFLSPLNEVIADLQAGKMCVLVDDADRENEGDLVVITELLQANHINFMMHEARGLICVSVSVEVAERLNLPLQVLDNNSPFNTPFTVSVDHVSIRGNGVTTDARIVTLKALISEEAKAEDFVIPGHTFPLIANPLGVIARHGQTEGSYDLAKLAGFKPSGVICEILNPDGTMARGNDLLLFAQKHQLKICSVKQIQEFRMQHEILVNEVAQSNLVTDYGQFTTYVFEDPLEGKEHLVLIYGELQKLQLSSALLRIHSECLTGDVFGSRRCDCGAQLSRSMQSIVKEGAGVILYLRQEGRGIGLTNKLRAYALQDQGHDTVEANIKLGFAADEREFAVATNILNHLGIKSVRLMTNNPEKFETLSRLGINVVERMPLVVDEDEFSKAYLETKRNKLGHWL